MHVCTGASSHVYGMCMARTGKLLLEAAPPPRAEGEAAGDEEYEKRMWLEAAREADEDEEREKAEGRGGGNGGGGRG